MRFPLCGPTYCGDATVLSDRCINFIPEINPENAKGQVTLRGTPGTSLWATCTVGNVRGMYVFGAFLWVVSGNKLYKFSKTKALTEIGTLTTSSGHIAWSDNGFYDGGGKELALSDYTTLKVVDYDTGTVSTISNPAAANSLEFMDGYIVAATKNSLTLRCSDIYDALTWNALATAKAGSAQDRVFSVVNNREQLWFIKEFTSEVWYNAGVATSTGFPFSRIQGMVFDFGTLSQYAVARGNNCIYFPAQQKTNDGSGGFVGIMEISGAGAQIVSPAPLNNYMSTLQWSSSISGPFGYCMVLSGHPLYILTYPEADFTVVYDAQTKMCFEWSTYKTPFVTGRHMGQCYAFFDGHHLVGDYASGNIYELSMDTYTDYNRDDANSPLPIVSTRIAPHLYDPDSLNRVFIKQFCVDMKSGVGTHSLNPQAQLSWSDDGGRNYSSIYLADIGKLGDYKKRVIWRKLGCSYDRIWKLTISEPIEKHIIGGYIE